MESRYIRRPLAEEIAHCPSKVVILEGARAVGKTRLVRTQLPKDIYTYYTLADPTTYEYAKKNAFEWVNSLRLPAIIDEAQRINDISLAVKERVDETGGRNPQVILTGSASIYHEGLSGQNPLTRRARTYTLYPLTAMEIANQTSNVVDELFSAAPNPDFLSAEKKENLYDKVSLGGFPIYVSSSSFMNGKERSLSVRNDIDNVLGDNILPDEKLDLAIAKAILNYLLCNPGGILNIKKICDLLGYNNRTVSRYISIFIRRFLVHTLPNLHTTASKQNFIRSKIHPIDTSFSWEALRATGKDPRLDQIVFGELFESYVVNQIVAAAEWSKEITNLFYWREPSNNPKEVDLVLQQNNELVGIEVKSSEKVTSGDFSGLRALARSKKLKRGFVIYCGSQIHKEDDNLWALPASSLWTPNSFLSKQEKYSTSLFYVTQSGADKREEVNVLDNISDNSDASVFLSYNHEDNTHLNGAIIKLAQKIAEQYKFQYGSTIDLFIDNTSIQWGQRWSSVLNAAIESTSFIMPAVTPNYIASASCRDELTKFAAKKANNENSHILTLLWQPFAETKPAKQNPQIAALIQKHQYIEVSALQDCDETDHIYTQTVRKLAERIREVVLEDERRIAANTENTSSTQNASEQNNSEHSLIDELANFEEVTQEFALEYSKVGIYLNNISQSINDNPAPQDGNPKTLKLWSIKLAKDTENDLSKLEESLTSGRKLWDQVYTVTDKYLDLWEIIPTEMKSADDLYGLREQIQNLYQSLNLPAEITSQIQIFNLLATMFVRQKPLANGITKVINTVTDIQNSATDLINHIDELLQITVSNA